MNAKFFYRFPVILPNLCYNRKEIMRRDLRFRLSKKLLRKFYPT